MSKQIVRFMIGWIVNGKIHGWTERTINKQKDEWIAVYIAVKVSD